MLTGERVAGLACSPKLLLDKVWKLFLRPYIISLFLLSQMEGISWKHDPLLCPMSVYRGGEHLQPKGVKSHNAHSDPARRLQQFGAHPYSGGGRKDWRLQPSVAMRPLPALVSSGWLVAVSPSYV